MATGDEILVRGAYATVQAASSTANGAVCAGANTDIGTALAATVEDYLLLDFKISVTVGTAVAGGTIDVYRRPSDGTNAAPSPTTTYLQVPVGSIEVDDLAASQYYYIYGVPNVDQNDDYFMVNNGGATLTIALSARGRSKNLAA